MNTIVSATDREGSMSCTLFVCVFFYALSWSMRRLQFWTRGARTKFCMTYMSSEAGVTCVRCPFYSHRINAATEILQFQSSVRGDPTAISHRSCNSLRDFVFFCCNKAYCVPDKQWTQFSIRKHRRLKISKHFLHFFYIFIILKTCTSYFPQTYSWNLEHGTLLSLN